MIKPKGSTVKKRPSHRVNEASESIDGEFKGALSILKAIFQVTPSKLHYFLSDDQNKPGQRKLSDQGEDAVMGAVFGNQGRARSDSIAKRENVRIFLRETIKSLQHLQPRDQAVTVGVAGGEAYLQWAFTPASSDILRPFQEVTRGLRLQFAMQSLRRKEARHGMRHGMYEIGVFRSPRRGYDLKDSKNNFIISESDSDPDSDLQCAWKFSSEEIAGIVRNRNAAGNCDGRQIPTVALQSAYDDWNKHLSPALTEKRLLQHYRGQQPNLAIEVGSYEYVVVVPTELLPDRTGKVNRSFLRELDVATRLTHFRHDSGSQTRRSSMQELLNACDLRQACVKTENFSQAYSAARRGKCAALIPNLALPDPGLGDHLTVLNLPELKGKQKLSVYAKLNVLRTDPVVFWAWYHCALAMKAYLDKHAENYEQWLAQPNHQITVI